MDGLPHNLLRPFCEFFCHDRGNGLNAYEVLLFAKYSFVNNVVMNKSLPILESLLSI